jgi:hypothetical protein
MRVADLIKQLQQLPPDARVVVHAGERGFYDAGPAQMVPLLLHFGEKHWRHWPHYGDHKWPLAKDGDVLDEMAVCIPPDFGLNEAFREQT